MVETCQCGQYMATGHNSVLCSIADIVTTTRPAYPDDPWQREKYYMVRVFNNCEACAATWVAIASTMPGYPTLVKNGGSIGPWEVVELGPIPGSPKVAHPATQVNFTCVLQH